MTRRLSPQPEFAGRLVTAIRGCVVTLRRRFPPWLTPGELIVLVALDASMASAAWGAATRGEWWGWTAAAGYALFGLLGTWSGCRLARAHYMHVMARMLLEQATEALAREPQPFTRIRVNLN